MRTCIYCGEEKLLETLTLEHVIPQFLGGAYAPEQFKIHAACGPCNNRLGLFVDASYARSWWITNWLALSARECLDTKNPAGIPLVCMGPTSMSPPDMAEDEVCESWLGPHGEQILWIRPNDERLYWYAGGNPIASRRRSSRAYFFFSENSSKNPLLAWLSFQDAFKERPVRKILCTTVEGADPKTIGFVEPDAIDNRRIEYFQAICFQKDCCHHISMGTNIAFDHRFMAKLGLGFGYVLFGESFLKTSYCYELRKGIWDIDGSANPAIYGSAMFGNERAPGFLKVSGHEHAVTIIIIPTIDGIALNLNIGAQYTSTVMCADRELMNPERIKEFSLGAALVLYPHLKKGFSMSLLELINHRLGHNQHADLASIDNFFKKRSIAA